MSNTQTSITLTHTPPHTNTLTYPYTHITHSLTHAHTHINSTPLPHTHSHTPFIIYAHIYTPKYKKPFIIYAHIHQHHSLTHTHTKHTLTHIIHYAYIYTFCCNGEGGTPFI